MAKKKFKVDKVAHWKPFRIDGAVYDLSHLDYHQVTYTLNNDPDKKPIEYIFHVTYSSHCFAKDYEFQTKLDKERLAYVAGSETRPFCFRRYQLSKSLPGIIENLDSSKLVFHGGYETFATCKAMDEDDNEVDYFVSFTAYRQQKKLRLHIQSAYPLNERLGKVKKVNIFAIARALLANKPLPKKPKP